MDDRDNEQELNKPIEGQMCYDELLLPEEEKEEEEPAPVVLDGQMDIWSLEKQEVLKEAPKVEQESDAKKEDISTHKEKPNEEKSEPKSLDENIEETQEKTQDSKYEDMQIKTKRVLNKVNIPKKKVEEKLVLDENKLLKDRAESLEENGKEESVQNHDKITESEKNDIEMDASTSEEKNVESEESVLDEDVAENEIIEEETHKESATIGKESDVDEEPTESENTDEESEDVEAENEEISDEAIKLHEKYEESLKKVERREKVMEEKSFYGDGGSGVITKNLSDVLRDSMIPYTEHVVMDRALPRVEDGLKPVQRRILYSMMELGLTPDKPYRKSARIVGDCMGKYHPHGDSSVYDAMVRMSQDFILRAPLVDGHGNFGSVDGDSAAAMRYTEARMTPLALELLRDLEKDTVRWSLNFDDTLKEPDILPGRFPNLLVNGASGIAVGVATNIPPHNLGEVIDGVVAYINKPNITLDEMMKIIKGPDFPTGGELIFGDGLRSAYEAGKGKITIRAKVGIEQNGDKQSLVITELPYQVNKSLLLQKIAELKEKNKDKLQDISEIRDESDRSGMRAIIRLKKDANAKKILAYLYQNTNMQLSYAINMVAIAGGKPKQMGLMEIISYYTAFQRDVIVRRTKYDLDIAKDRAHIVEGLLIAIKNIDAVIKIIKTSASVSEAKTRLRAKFNLSEKQAQAILDMRLSRLVNLEVTKLQQELKDLKEKIKEYGAILASKKRQLEVVKTEILEIKRRFNSPRRSHENKSDDIVLKKLDEEEMVVNKEYYLLLTAGKTIKKVNMSSYMKSTRTIGDSSTLFDIVTQKLKVKSTDQVLILTERGNCVKVNVAQIAECKWRDKGVTLKQIDRNVDIMETPVSIVPVSSQEIIMMTKKGMIKRMKNEDAVITKSYYQVLKVAEDDVLINAELDEKGKNILMFTKHGYTVNFDKSEVPLQGRISGGVMGVNLEKDDYVVYAGQNRFDSVIVITDKGFVKRLSTVQIPTCARYRKGVKYCNFSNGGKGVLYVGGAEQAVIDLGLKFKIIEAKKVKISNDRLASGTQEVKEKVIDVYSFVD